MSPKAPLDRLAEIHHIEPAYDDIWQRRHEAGADTKRALLRAMGVEVDSAAAIETSLKAAAARSFEPLAPPVLVVTEGAWINLPIAAAAKTSGRIAWMLTTEDGEESEGDAVLSDLDILDQAARRAKHALPLPHSLQPGYHRLTLALGGTAQAETEIIVTPKRAFLPEALDRKGGFTGLTAPLYGLRSNRNAGIGDFSDLAGLAGTAAPLGADFIGINPVHALFPAEPGRISPYSPSSRLFLNTLLIALDQAPELDQSEPARRLLEGTAPDPLRASKLVDYPAVSAFKRQVLEALFEAFSALPPSSPRRTAFEAFRTSGGEALERHARFEALAEHFSRSGPGNTEWQRWPAGYRDPGSKDVQAFAQDHHHRVAFYTYLQWLAATQLEHAQQSATAAGGLGLYLDLAVGTAPDGAEAWSDQNVLVNGVRIGAPPDDFNPKGQNWGLLPLSPQALRTRRYRPFIDLLRHNMRSAGALRIDHVLGLARSFWLPADGAAHGAYIRYPMADLLGLVALESVRNRCLVVGEDLGTVPNALRQALDDRGLLGCRLLYFERDEDGACRPASAYPKTCIASIGTHDLPTLKGFWEGCDIAWRERLGLYADETSERADRAGREQVQTDLLHRLEAEGLLPDSIDPEQPPAALSENLTLAFHRFLGMTPALLKAVQLEDAVGAVEQANLPGTVDEHPNWRRKIGPPLEALSMDKKLSILINAICANVASS